MESERYRDFDEFAESVRGIDAQMLFQNPTRRIWEIDGLNLPGVRVQLGRLGSGNIVEGVSSPDQYMVYLPLTDECPYSANGEVIPKHAFAVLEPGCDFCVSTPSEHDWCTVLLPRQWMAQTGEDKTVCRVTRPNPLQAQRFLAFVEGVLGTASQHPEFEGSVAATRAAAELLNLSTLILGAQNPKGTERTGRPRLPRRQIVRRSLELLEERGAVRTTVADLATASDVSERTLRSAFHEYFGVGPARYLRLRQLHRVHHELRQADADETRVSRVVLGAGSWQLGKFAAQYRRHFGELPSETLRATKRR